MEINRDLIRHLAADPTLTDNIPQVTVTFINGCTADVQQITTDVLTAMCYVMPYDRILSVVRV